MSITCCRPPTRRSNDICSAFAIIIDAKSPSTSHHSSEVARVALRIAAQQGHAEASMQTLERAALLHDLGKLGVPNSILEKPSQLSLDEWECVKRHPQQTFQILNRVPTFGAIAEIAANHHEKLDGSGNHRGLAGESLCASSRVLAVADIFEALTAPRAIPSGSQARRSGKDHATLDAPCA